MPNSYGGGGPRARAGHPAVEIILAVVQNTENERAEIARGRRKTQKTGAGPQEALQGPLVNL